MYQIFKYPSLITFKLIITATLVGLSGCGASDKDVSSAITPNQIVLTAADQPSQTAVSNTEAPTPSDENVISKNTDASLPEAVSGIDGKEFNSMIDGGRRVDMITPTSSSVARLMIKRADGNIGICTGTAISRWWVLTAAHCFIQGTKHGTKTTKSQSADIVIGDNTPNDANTNRKFSSAQVVTHPNYIFATNNNDIALVKLNRPIDFNLITPSALDYSSINYENIFFIYGFGLASQPNAPVKINTNGKGMYSSNVKFASNSNCTYNGRSQSYFVCVKDSEVVVRAGDSGGPALRMSNGFSMITAIAMLGTNDKIHNKYVSTYTTVEPYVEWINSVMKAPCSTCVAYHFTQQRNSDAIRQVIPIITNPSYDMMEADENGEFMMPFRSRYQTYAKLIRANDDEFTVANDSGFKVEVQRWENTLVGETWKTVQSFDLKLQEDAKLNTGIGFEHSSAKKAQYRLVLSTPASGASNLFTVRVYASKVILDTTGTVNTPPRDCGANSTTEDICTVGKTNFDKQKNDGATFWWGTTKGSFSGEL